MPAAPPAPPLPPLAVAYSKGVGSLGASLGAGVSATKQAFAYHVEYVAKCSDAVKVATHSLRTVAAIATDLEDPRTGVAVYAFARDQVFADVEAAASHLTDLEGDVLTEMFANTNYYGGMTSGVVHAPWQHPAIRRSLQQLGAVAAEPVPELASISSVLETDRLHNKWIKRYGDR
eukprot:gene22385-15412_t